MVSAKGEFRVSLTVTSEPVILHGWPTPSVIQTSQVPPKPTVTLPSWTITGIFRLPLVNCIIRWSPASSSKTLT